MELRNLVPDREILLSLQTGSRMNETIRVLYRDHFENLSWFIQNNGGNRQDAEDIFQEVIVSFIDLVRKDRFRGESSIKTFLFSVNRNLWLNEWKKRDRAMIREQKYEAAGTKEEADISHQIAEKEERDRLIALVDQLGDTCKKILLLFYYEGRSMKEIWEELDYDSEQVVRNKKHKCMKKLEELINANPSIKNTLKTLLNG
ncbi:MAG: sigma-70 family RNA polymerase sigma factor [Chitinophagaceae bacterium]|nr:sigma-70 family RNA polymerase sigma factor [Chitinophagaceae bacterium]MBN8667534.1 sigma-70 family RNA polymerase sigma factor [Chitinophagales bacterium]